MSTEELKTVRDMFVALGYEEAIDADLDDGVRWALAELAMLRKSYDMACAHVLELDERVAQLSEQVAYYQRRAFAEQEFKIEAESKLAAAKVRLEMEQTNHAETKRQLAEALT